MPRTPAGRPGAPALTLVADDLTGAADSAAPLAPLFPPAWLLDHRRLEEPPGAAPPRMIAVYTATRGADPEAARRVLEGVGGRLAALGAGSVFKKIDSTLRGNIGVEIEALMGGLGLEASFIAPAFPEQGRTTSGGVHRLHGVPVAETEIGRDPLAPVADSRIDRLIGGQTAGACAHVGLEAVQAGGPRLAEAVARLLAHGVRHLTFDAETQDDLDRIAALALGRHPRVLLCGAAGLARGLAAAVAAGRPSPPRPAALWRAPAAAGMLYVCGSASSVLRRQVGELVGAEPVRLVELPIEALLDPRREAALAALSARAAAALDRGAVALQIAAGRGGGGAPAVDPRELTARLAKLAAEICAARRPAGLFLSGGDTAAAVLETTRYHALLLAGGFGEGIILGVVRGGALDGLPVATKAGAFGRPEALRRFHAGLAAGAERVDSPGDPP